MRRVLGLFVDRPFWITARFKLCKYYTNYQGGNLYVTLVVSFPEETRINSRIVGKIWNTSLNYKNTSHSLNKLTLQI